MLADPRARHGLDVKIGFIIKSKDIDGGKRLTLVIPRERTREVEKKLHDDASNLVIYIKQTGRGSIVGYDGCIYKIRKKVGLKYNGRYALEARSIVGKVFQFQEPTMIKVDIEEIMLEEDHLELLKAEIDKVL